MTTVELYRAQLADLEAALNRTSLAFADELRLAVADFNAAGVSLSAVDTFRDRVLWIADHLAEPLAGGRLVQVVGIGESRRVDSVRRLDEVQARRNASLNDGGH